MQGKIINTIVILLSTCENGFFDASFKSVGGVETEILMSQKWTFYDFSVFINVSASTPPADVKLTPKCLLSECYDMTLIFI